MTRRIGVISLSVAMGAALVFASVGAVSAKDATAAADSKDRDADDEVKQPSQMSRKEKITWVEDKVGDAYEIRGRVQSMLDQTRKEKDSIKISCLADKLTQLEVNLQGIEERRSAFDVALSDNNAAAADQQFTVLQIYIGRIDGLMAEADNCVGEGDVVVGESETTVTIDEDITVDDPSNPSEFQPIGIDQPLHASAYY